MVIWALVSVPLVIESRDMEWIDPVAIMSFAEAMDGAAFVGIELVWIVTVAGIAGDGETNGVNVIDDVASNGGFTLGVQEIIIVFNRIKKTIRTLHRLNFAKGGSKTILKLYAISIPCDIMPPLWYIRTVSTLPCRSWWSAASFPPGFLESRLLHRDRKSTISVPRSSHAAGLSCGFFILDIIRKKRFSTKSHEGHEKKL